MRFAAMIVAVGFLLASAFMNFQYGHSLGRTPIEAWVYGLVGVLAVASNALCPFLIAWHARWRLLVGGISMLWALCLVYSLSSAIGFAAENRQALVGGREALSANYELTIKSLAEHEAKRTKYKTDRYDNRIEALRREAKALRAKGGHVDVDPQATVLAGIIPLAEAADVRLGLLVVFGFIVELGAALVLFAALSPPAQMTALRRPKAPKLANAATSAWSRDWRPQERWTRR